jgi:hypothetical protein
MVGRAWEEEDHETRWCDGQAADREIRSAMNPKSMWGIKVLQLMFGVHGKSRRDTSRGVRKGADGKGR